MKKTSKAPVKARQRYSASYKSEALALAERIGVPAAAKQLGLHESQFYGWRSKAQANESRSDVEQQQATEIARLKRQLAEREEELAICGEDHFGPISARNTSHSARALSVLSRQ